MKTIGSIYYENYVSLCSNLWIVNLIENLCIVASLLAILYVSCVVLKI